MNNWTRAHDKWIAEKCEGFKHSHYPYYDRYITSAIQAAEGWVSQSLSVRWYDMGRYLHGTDEFKFLASFSECVDGGCKNYHGKANTPAAAIAWALYRATGGVE